MLDINDFGKKQIIFVFLNVGEKISYSNDNIIVKTKEGTIKYQTTCYRIFALFVVGNFTLTSGLLQRAKKYGFGIVLMTHSLRVYEILCCPMEGNTLLHRHQYVFKGNELGKHIIINKIINQRYYLNKIRKKNEEIKNAIQIIDKSLKHLQDSEYNDLSSIMGVEGSIARVYFNNIFDSVDWKGRKPRIKFDMTNSVLDIGYTILFNFIEALLNLYGFDLFVGVLHQQFYMRKSLVCDLIEPFRAMIDWQIRKSINLGQFKEDDFNVINGQYLLKWSENPKYVSILMEPLLEHRAEIFLYIQAYYRAFMKQKSISEYPLFLAEEA
jgi:CRISPR-associated protein Cas1